MKTVHDARDARYMRMALKQAENAIRLDEVPVGAVVVLDGKVIGRGHNLNRRRKDPTAHAEIVALRQAAARMKNDRLAGAELFCTLEPCPMCAGAIVHARIRRVVFGTPDPKAGACGSVVKVLPNRKLNHRPDVVKMVLADEAAGLLTDFFKVRRALRRKQKAL